MEDLVTYQITKKLKEKGFPIKGKEIISGDNGVFIPTPTIAQVLKWLRKLNEMHIAVGYSGETKWCYVIIYLNEAYFDKPNITVKRFGSYEQASLAGIEYVLDKLI